MLTPSLKVPEIYIEKSLSALESALHRIGTSQELMRELDRMWERRAELFFSYDYMEHKFDAVGSRVYTLSNPEVFNSRRLVDYNIRNPASGISAETAKFRAVDWRDPLRTFAYTSGLFKTSKWQAYFRRILHLHLRDIFIYLELLSIRKSTAIVDLVKKLSDDTLLDEYLKLRQASEMKYSYASTSPIHVAHQRAVRKDERINLLDFNVMLWNRIRFLKNITNGRVGQGQRGYSSNDYQNPRANVPKTRKI